MSKGGDKGDKALIKACLNNSRKAQEQLYRKYAKPMFHICLSYCANRDTAKDVLQEAFIKVFRKLRDFDSGNSFEGWLKRIVINTAIDHLRQSKRWMFIEHREYIDEPVDSGGRGYPATGSYDPDQEPVFPPDSKKVMRMIGNLPAGARTVFNLFALDELSHKEIASRLNISEGTSKSQYNRARSLLKQWLKEGGGS